MSVKIYHDLGKVRLTLEQIDNMRHAIGFEPANTRKGQRRYVFSRNYFAASRGRPDPDWDDLVVQGFAERLYVPEERFNYYAVTPQGLRVLEKIFRINFEEGM